MKRLKKPDYIVDAVTAAKMLLGKWLCRQLEDGTVLKTRIVETEAYCGEGDTACHAHCGKTERNAPMYEAGGIAYVYLCYGMHNLLNVVTGARVQLPVQSRIYYKAGNIFPVLGKRHCF